MYVDQSIKLQLNKRETRSATEEDLDEDVVYHWFCFQFFSEYLTNEALKWFGDFKIGAQVIRIVKYADDLVQLAREVMVLQGMIDTLIEIGRWYRLEMDVKKVR